MDKQDRLIRDPECERMTGLKRGIRFQMEARGEFPKRRQITERLTGYSFLEVQAWVAEKLENAPIVDYSTAAKKKTEVA